MVVYHISMFILSLVTFSEVENILTCLVELLQTGVEEVSHLSSDLVAVLSSMCLSHGHW